MPFVEKPCITSYTEDEHTISRGLIIYEKKGAVVTVNLSGGCSVDFAYGAIYFYDNAHHLSENDPVTAYGFIMDKQEYDEYTDYQWWLGRTEDGSWDIVSTGY